MGPSDIGKLQEWQQNSCHSVSVPKGTSEISFSFEDSSTTMGTKWTFGTCCKDGNTICQARFAVFCTTIISSIERAKLYCYCSSHSAAHKSRDIMKVSCEWEILVIYPVPKNMDISRACNSYWTAHVTSTSKVSMRMRQSYGCLSNLAPGPRSIPKSGHSSVWISHFATSRKIPVTNSAKSQWLVALRPSSCIFLLYSILMLHEKSNKYFLAKYAYSSDGILTFLVNILSVDATR